MNENELEILAEYDEDTGATKETSVASAQEEEIASLLAKAEALTALKSTPGWYVVSEFIKEQITAHTAKLITESSFSEIRRIQEYLKALHNIQAYVDVTISEASQFAENVSQQTQDPE